MILLVKFTSALAEPKLAERLREHATACHQVPRLRSGVFGREATSGDVCGIYTFADEASLQAFQRSEAAHLLPSALEVSEVRMEVIAPWPVGRATRSIVEEEPLVARIAEALAGARIADPDRLAAVVEPYVADLGWQTPGRDARGSVSRAEALRAALARLSPADRRRLERILTDAHDHQPPAGGQPARTRVPARKGAQDDV